MKPIKVQRTGPSVMFIWPDRHLFVFRPSRLHGAYSAWGFHLRRRLASNRWRHTILRLGVRGESKRPGQTGTRIWEIQSYESKKASAEGGINDRLTYKRFFRVKVGYGGVIGGVRPTYGVDACERSLDLEDSAL